MQVSDRVALALIAVLAIVLGRCVPGPRVEATPGPSDSDSEERRVRAARGRRRLELGAHGLLRVPLHAHAFAVVIALTPR